MNSHCCCHKKSRAEGDMRQKSKGLRRIREIFAWIVPAGLLALMPKCPMCLAAYVALGTGFTISSLSAHILMRLLTVLCIGTLALCVTRRVISYVHNKQTFDLQLSQSHQ